MQVLDETRAAVAGDADLSKFRDATLARYLRHNSWVAEPAIKQMKTYMVIGDNDMMNRCALLVRLKLTGCSLLLLLCVCCRRGARRTTWTMF